MQINKHAKNIFIWFLPAFLLLLTLFPIPLPSFYGLILEIVISVTAVFIAYLLFTERPQYYLIWGTVFVLILLIYNPIIHLNVSMGIPVPLALITAILYLTNWWFVFKSRSPVL